MLREPAAYLSNLDGMLLSRMKYVCFTGSDYLSNAREPPEC